MSARTGVGEGTARTVLTDAKVAGLPVRAREYAVQDLRTPGLALRVLPSGRRSWTWRGTIGGTSARRTVGSFPAVTTDAARAAVASLLVSGPCSGPVARSRVRAAIGPLFKTLAGECVASKNAGWKRETRDSYRRHLTGSLLPAFGHLRASSITHRDVADWFHAKGRTAPGGANRALTCLRMILRTGDRWGRLGEGWQDPTVGIVRFNEHPVGRVLTGDELTRLLAVLHDPKLRRLPAVVAIELLLLTGCRPREIFGLRWDQWERGRGRGAGTLRLPDTKTGPREVVLSRSAEAILRHRERCPYGPGGRPPSPYVFPSPVDPDRPQREYDRIWKTIRMQAGLPPSFRLYDLRHSYASHAMMAGGSLATVGALLGHADAKSTERYVHPGEGELARIAATLGDTIRTK